jgi:hypothetical protein
LQALFCGCADAVWVSGFQIQIRVYAVLDLPAKNTLCMQILCAFMAFVDPVGKLRTLAACSTSDFKNNFSHDLAN